MIRQIILSALVLSILLPMTLEAQEASEPKKRPEPEKELIDGDFMYTVIPPGAIPEINDPVFVDASDAAPWMNDDEMIIGVLGPDREARAYSTWHLDHHEIVNDHAGETPIAVTW